MNTGYKIARLVETFGKDGRDDVILTLADLLGDDLLADLCEIVEESQMSAAERYNQDDYDVGYETGYERGGEDAECSECPPCPHKRMEEARKLRVEGLSFAAIGKQLGVSRQRVHQMLRDAP